MMKLIFFFGGVFLLGGLGDALMVILMYFLGWGLLLKVSLGEGAQGLGYFFGGDSLSLSLSLLSVWVGGLALIASYYFLLKSYYSSEFILVNVSLVFFLLMSFLSLDLLYFYVSFEVVLIPMLILLTGFGYQPERLQAGLYMLFYTVFGSLPLLAMLLGYKLKWFSLNYLYLLICGGDMGSKFWGFLVMGFLIKLPVYLFHFWLPKAHVEAPLAGSMILAGVLLKLGGYGLYRVGGMVSIYFIWYSSYIFSVGLLGGLMMALVCLRQSDMKMLVAYSSVGHMGLLLSGYATFTLFGLSGGMMMMVAHGLSSSGLFSVVNLFYERLHSRSMLLVKGALIYFPSLSIFMFLLSISNMAAPPFLNLLSEMFLGISIISWSLMNFFFLGFMFFLSACYSLYFFSVVWHGRESHSYGGGLILVGDYLMLFLHLAPLCLLVLNLEILFWG